MRHRLGALTLTATLLTAALAGCGGDSGDDTASDPASEPTAGQTSSADPSADPPSGPSDRIDVVLVHETAAGGSVSDRLTPVGEAGQLDAFVEQFGSSGLVGEVRDAVASVRDDGGEPWAATVSIGCDVPPAVLVSPDGESFSVAPQKIKNPLPECYAPVTTVAVVDVS